MADSVMADSVDHGPFAGLADHDLSGRPLTLAEKRWLGEQQVTKVASARLLADRYGLNADTLRRYALRLKKSLTFTGVKGRPLGCKDKTARKRRTKTKIAETAKEEVVKDEAATGKSQELWQKPLCDSAAAATAASADSAASAAAV